MKHIFVDFHFVRDRVHHGLVRVSLITSANVLTKPLLCAQFLLLRSKIGVSSRSSILRGHIREDFVTWLLHMYTVYFV